jgi:hypothetical protein
VETPSDGPAVHTHALLKGPTLDSEERSVVSKIRRGQVEVLKHGILKLQGKHVVFEEGEEREFNSIIFADPGIFSIFSCFCSAFPSLYPR